MDSDERKKARETLIHVYRALHEKGYNPVMQILGYLLSGDETYITPNRNARNIIRRIDREDLIEELLREYFRGETE